MSAPAARAPSDPRWRQIPFPNPCIRAFQRGRVRVLSQIASMDAPDGSGDALDTWLVSVSEIGCSMPNDETMARVRRDFSMDNAEEDNHEPGRARKLFLVVDPSRRVECECKTDERVIVREDGYRYTQPTSEPGAERRP